MGEGLHPSTEFSHERSLSSLEIKALCSVLVIFVSGTAEFQHYAVTVHNVKPKINGTIKYNQQPPLIYTTRAVCKINLFGVCSVLDLVD